VIARQQDGADGYLLVVGSKGSKTRSRSSSPTRSLGLSCHGFLRNGSDAEPVIDVCRSLVSTKAK